MALRQEFVGTADPSVLVRLCKVVGNITAEHVHETELVQATGYGGIAAGEATCQSARGLLAVALQLCSQGVRTAVCLRRRSL